MALPSSDNDDVMSISSLCSVSSICSTMSSYGYMEHKDMMLMREKRRLFLKSYQFCRKRPLSERIKTSLVKVKRVMWFRLRSVRKMRRLVLSKLRFAFSCRGRGRRYSRVKNNNRSLNSCCLC